MSCWVLPAGGVAETVICVLSPEEVIGEAAWIDVVGQADTTSKTAKIHRVSVAS